MRCLSAILSVLAINSFVWFSAVNAKFPDDPKPCKYGDSECIVKIINYLVHEKRDGDSSINFVKIDPLRVSKIGIHQGSESPVNIDLDFTQNDVIGLSSSTITKVKGFDKDLTKRHEVQFKFPKASLVGDYKIAGKVLILPIRGNGKSNMTLMDTVVTMSFVGKPYEKDGETYMKAENLKLDFEPARLYYYFGNLFNGDKALGENMNLFLNENWRDIFNEVRVSLTEAFARIFESIISNVFSKYPYDKFFTD